MPIHQRSQKILLVGESHNVVKQFPMFGKGSPLYWWHEKGYIHWEDSRPKGERPDQYYGLMSWQEFAERVLNLSEMITKSSEQGDYADERKALQAFVCSAEILIRQAREHGVLHDKGASEEHKRRRSKTMIVPRQMSNVVVGNGDAKKLGVGQRKMVDPFDL